MLRLPVREQKQTNPAKKRVETPPMTKGNMQVRVVSLAVLIAAVFLILGARLWYLQVLTGQDYTLAARATQHTNIKIPAQRGVVYDRDGKILANNVPGLNVTVIPDEISRDKVRELATVVEADTDAVLARYDAALCMYHDQALIPIKALHFEEAVNVTLGLPIVRTAPDHGTAFDIAGQDRADPRPMAAAIRMAAENAILRAEAA